MNQEKWFDSAALFAAPAQFLFFTDIDVDGLVNLGTYVLIGGACWVGWLRLLFWAAQRRYDKENRWP